MIVLFSLRAIVMLPNPFPDRSSGTMANRQATKPDKPRGELIPAAGSVHSKVHSSL